MSAPRASLGLGYLQSMVNQTSVRASNTPYTNTTGRTIAVFAGAQDHLAGYVDGFQIWFNTSASGVETNTVFLLVPPGSTYQVDRTNSPGAGLAYWGELT